MATNKVTTNVIDMSGNTGGLVWAQGTQAQRPGAPVSGDLRLNTDDSRLEFYSGTDWKRFSEGAALTSGIDFLVVGNKFFFFFFFAGLSDTRKTMFFKTNHQQKRLPGIRKTRRKNYY